MLPGDVCADGLRQHVPLCAPQLLHRRHRRVRAVPGVGARAVRLEVDGVLVHVPHDEAVDDLALWGPGY